jgi:hypothetical protein
MILIDANILISAHVVHPFRTTVHVIGSISG